MVTYEISNGSTYAFSFEQQSDGSVRPYITTMPSYGSRDTNLHTTHRLRDGNRYYVCWTQKLYSEQDAKAVAAQWASRTERYIRSGKRFEE